MSEPAKKFEKREDEVGALWIKEGANGPFLSGTINDVKVVVFKNTYKQEGSNAPDYRCYRAKARDAQKSDADDSLVPF